MEKKFDDFTVENMDSQIPNNKPEVSEYKETLPCVPLRGLTILPHTVVHFDIGRDKSLRALENAMATDKIMFVSSQIDDNVLIPTIKDIYPVGTIVKVKQMLKVQGGAVRVLVEGLSRASINQCVSESGFISVIVDVIEEDITEEDLTLENRATLRVATEKLMEYANVVSSLSDEVVEKIMTEDSPVAKADKIANEILLPTDRKQKILDTLDFGERLETLVRVISEEIEIATLEKEVSQKVKASIDNGQKEYYIREKIKAMQSELGVEEDAGAEAAEWISKLDELKLSEDIDTKVRKEINKFSRMQPSSAESAVSRNYIETILDLPWNTSSEVNSDLKKAEKILEQDHYGMEKVKERVLEYLAVTHLSDAIKGPILCLVGPPGVGKTSIAKSIARATGREFIRMALGGVRDEAEIRGHRRTYIGAIPGRVINSIKESKTNNPLFLFDEVDKIGSDFRGDPASALLEVLDPEQNSTFTDHFLEVPFDLSKVMFITTANTTDTIPGPLLDRMELIEVPSYTEEEKVEIARKYLLPKQIKENGLNKDHIRVSTKAIHDVANYYTRESGVRNLERELGNLCRKVAKKVVTEEDKTYSITPKNLEKYLGKHRYHYDKVNQQDKVGVVTGLAWTAVGGVTLQIEVADLPGNGKISLTGKLGDVMQESARTGISYIRSIAEELGIPEDFYEKKDLHIHIPEGAVPKDGPSAGVTMATAVISALTDVPVKSNVAMTGEITLRGNVLPVGGIREKVMAAHRAGIRKVLIPRDNNVDLDDIPEKIRSEMEFVLLDNVGQALEHALTK